MLQTATNPNRGRRTTTTTRKIMRTVHGLPRVEEAKRDAVVPTTAPIVLRRRRSRAWTVVGPSGLRGKKTRERRVRRSALLAPEEIENEGRGRGRGRLSEPSMVCPGLKKQSGTLLCRPLPNRPSSSSSGMDGCWSKRFARKENAGTEGTAVGSARSRRDRERRTRDEDDRDRKQIDTRYFGDGTLARRRELHTAHAEFY